MSIFKHIALLILFVILLIPNKSISQEIEQSKLHQFTGTILDFKDKAIPFVHILVKNFKRGTISDFDGFFSLVVQPNDTIIFSSIGYKRFSLIIPDTSLNDDIYARIKLETDTIILSEAIVFPWNTYEKFKEAFLQLNAPDDDIERALINFALIEKQLLDENYAADASLSYKYFMQQTYNQLYYAGQLPPNNLLNPNAWAQFFKALREGDFKRRD